MKKYTVWYTFGFLSQNLPFPIEAANEDEAVKKFVATFRKKGKKFNSITAVELDKRITSEDISEAIKEADENESWC